MARGFDSKSVTDQQDERERKRDGTARPAAHPSPRRRTLELARQDLQHRIRLAPEMHRASLQAALLAVEEQLQLLTAAEPAPRPPEE